MLPVDYLTTRRIDYRRSSNYELLHCTAHCTCSKSLRVVTRHCHLSYALGSKAPSSALQIFSENSFHARFYVRTVPPHDVPHLQRTFLLNFGVHPQRCPYPTSYSTLVGRRTACAQPLAYTLFCFRYYIDRRVYSVKLSHSLTQFSLIPACDSKFYGHS